VRGRIISCSWLLPLWSRLVWFGLVAIVSAEEVGLGALFLEVLPSVSWTSDVLLLPRFGHMMFYFCLDFVCVRKIRVLFDSVVLVALFGWIILVSESWQLSWFWFDYCSCSVLVMLLFQELFRKALGFLAL
jgi:hypothetical protein